MFGSPGKLENVAAECGYAGKESCHLFAELPMVTGGYLPGDERREGADIFRNGHFIVIEDNDEILAEMTCLVECFKRHPAGQ